MTKRQELVEKLDAAAAKVRDELPEHLCVQVVPPRDQFKSCTLTIEQWLENSESDGWFTSRTEKWRTLLKACALVHQSVAGESGLRHEPRVGFDPVGDQFFFIFKASNNGTTFFVSPHGLQFWEGEEYDIHEFIKEKPRTSLLRVPRVPGGPIPRI